MILCDYYRSKPDLTWEIGRQLGVKHGVVRLPEDKDFDPANRQQRWKQQIICAENARKTLRSDYKASARESQNRIPGLISYSSCTTGAFLV